MLEIVNDPLLPSVVAVFLSLESRNLNGLGPDPGCHVPRRARALFQGKSGQPPARPAAFPIADRFEVGHVQNYRAAVTTASAVRYPGGEGPDGSD